MVGKVQTKDNGKEFEARAVAIARAIYDPSGTQGATMFQGREHDAVFITDQAVVAFEFTQLEKKEKARSDAEKIRDILLYMRRKPENLHRFVNGFFVTEKEPTAEQRDVVARVARDAQIEIKCVSLVTLRRSLIDTEEYIAKRESAPFGSTAFKLPSGGGPSIQGFDYVEPTIRDRQSRGERSLSDIEAAAVEGARLALLGDFGSGKSEAMLQLFRRLRKRYFKDPSNARFPLHINLRDCYGLRTPTEVVRRHAEEIGFARESTLVAAWRAGSSILLLDGFDELVPTRWVGGARNLKQVRWQALEPVRRLVNETPGECGIVITGRAQYFSTTNELLECLGLDSSPVYELDDLSDDQVEELIGGTRESVPDWVPRRVLLLRFLIENRLLPLLSSGPDAEVSDSWLRMIDLIAAREADRITSVTRDSVRKLISRIATIARSESDNLGSISVDAMKVAFREVCGYEPDEEGLQLLLRLPGLSNQEVDRGGGNREELRRFIDIDLANSAYGLDLAEYVAAPYSAHPLADSASWTASSGELEVSVASAHLMDNGYEASQCAHSISRRLDASKFDAVLLDVCNLGDYMGLNLNGPAPFFSELIIEKITLTSDTPNLNRSTFRDCLIDVLDVSDLPSDGIMPTFQRCAIDNLDGWTQIPDRFLPNFDAECEIDKLTAPVSTSMLKELSVDPDTRVALVVLRKVFLQAGSGRRISALPRGIPPIDRPRVPAVTSRLVSMGYVERVTHRGQDLVRPVREKRGEVLEILSAPKAFRLPT